MVTDCLVRLRLKANTELWCVDFLRTTSVTQSFPSKRLFGTEVNYVAAKLNDHTLTIVKVQTLKTRIASTFSYPGKAKIFADSLNDLWFISIFWDWSPLGAKFFKGRWFKIPNLK